MTKEEAMKKIEELEDYIKKLDEEVGFEDDDLFLLSAEEYEKYKRVIPNVNCLWWLRSPADTYRTVTFVGSNGLICYDGHDVYYDIEAIRPALKFYWRYRNYHIGERVIEYNFPFICIDPEKSLFIAEVPIGFSRFDEKSEEYKSSEIRQWLKNWKGNRYKNR